MALQAAWRRKEMTAAESSAAEKNLPYVVLAGTATGDVGRTTKKGYVPLALVGDDGQGEERVLVHVAMLKEPCMAGLLEMAAQQFGYGQRGVLRIPCDGRQFHQMMVSVHDRRSR